MNQTASRQVGETVLALPIAEATEGRPAVDVSTLLRDAGGITLDYGFANTAATRSAITYIDGDAGILRYRGYPIEQVKAWTTAIGRHTLLHEEFRRYFDGFPKDAHPMGILASATADLSTFYQDSEDPFDGAGAGRPQRRVLHLPQALPDRRLLQRPHQPRAGLPGRDVHGPVRDRPGPRLGRPGARERDYVPLAER